MDEIVIRKHDEWDGTIYHGYRHFGSEIQNASWKILAIYFLCNNLNSTQKLNLVTDLA